MSRMVGFFLVLSGVGIGCTVTRDKSVPVPVAPSSVSAILEPAAEGRLKLIVTNTSDKTVRFLDIREGAAWCDRFWRIEVRLANKKTLPACMLYSPADAPFEVMLEPGQQRIREFNLGAYVQLPYEDIHGQKGKPATVTVHYEVDPATYKEWTTAPYLRFSSAPLLMNLER